jgi:hypothetical protein
LIRSIGKARYALQSSSLLQGLPLSTQLLSKETEELESILFRTAYPAQDRHQGPSDRTRFRSRICTTQAAGSVPERWPG